MGDVLNRVAWGHRWFGFWREDGEEFAECPMLADWVDAGCWKDRPVERVASYLIFAPVVVATGPERCGLCSVMPSQGIAYRTDGEWYWPDALAHQVVVHHVCLPEAFRSKMEQASYSPPGSLWDNPRQYRAVLERLEVPAAHKDLIANAGRVNRE
jgi:hypothetical protein